MFQYVLISIAIYLLRIIFLLQKILHYKLKNRLWMKMSTTWRTAHLNLIHVADLELSNSTFKKVRHVFYDVTYRIIKTSNLFYIYSWLFLGSVVMFTLNAYLDSDLTWQNQSTLAQVCNIQLEKQMTPASWKRKTILLDYYQRKVRTWMLNSNIKKKQTCSKQYVFALNGSRNFHASLCITTLQAVESFS